MLLNFTQSPAFTMEQVFPLVVWILTSNDPKSLKLVAVFAKLAETRVGVVARVETSEAVTWVVVPLTRRDAKQALEERLLNRTVSSVQGFVESKTESPLKSFFQI